MNVPDNILSSIPFKYAESVISGEIVTGPYIKKSVERFYDWIENAEEKGYRLDHSHGMHVILFFEKFLVHTKSEKGGEPFILSPYQQFTLYNIFAWKKQNSKGNWVRVIRTIYEKVARKNGKTATLAGLGLYCQAFDGEHGPEIYVGATKEQQAKILWEQAYQFVYKSQKLRKIGFANTQREIRFKRNLGVFRFLGGDSKTLDGLSPSLAIIDEYHSHKDDSVREVLESAMGAREQPIIYIITTSGFNTASVCKQYEDVCKEILDGLKHDDSTFIMIHEPDQDDNWEDPESWKKANPNLGVSVNMEYLEDEYQKAVNQPSKSRNFKTKHVNKWVDETGSWIPSEIWNKGTRKHIPIEKFKKFGSFMAGDLSTRKDITALAALSEPDEEDYRYLKMWFFCPEETIDSRSKEDRVPYRAWADAGFLIPTPGNTVDYNYFKDKIAENYYTHNVERIELDQWNSSQVAIDLDELGLEVSFFPQAISVINHPTKEFEKLVLEGKILHEGNPVMAWMMGGCVIYQDANENIKVHKGKSNSGNKRVDGPIAAIMALGGSLSIEQTDESKYNNPNEEIIM